VQPTREQVAQLKWWAKRTDAAPAFAIAHAVFMDAFARLNDVLLPLGGGHRMLSATLSWTTETTDPDPEVQAHAVVSTYRTRTMVV
jgi:hypothetical protein